MGEHDSGYSIIAKVFDAPRMSLVLEVITKVNLPRSKAGIRHVLGVPTVRELAADSALAELASSFIGAQPIAFRATLFEKSPEANWLVVWHQDTALPVRIRAESAGWVRGP